MCYERESIILKAEADMIDVRMRFEKDQAAGYVLWKVTVLLLVRSVQDD